MVKMEELINLMNKVFADSFKMYLKAHNFHWNVEGKDFPQYHAFFGDLYEEVFESLDRTAEQIRTLDAYVPGTIDRIDELSTVPSMRAPMMRKAMVLDLYNANLSVIASLNAANTLAERFNELGLANYIQDRLEAHKKHGWMLKASMKEDPNE